MRVGSMFSGVGGLDLAVQQLFPDAEHAWFFEWEDAPSRVLAHHWPDVPNYRDVTTWDQHDLGEVDALVGGFPCQDLSHAGKGAGLKRGTRSGLWFHMADAIAALRPRLVLLENVQAILTAQGGNDDDGPDRDLGERGLGGPSAGSAGALGVVLGSLAEIGFDAVWTCLRAADVGACHGRARWFCVAYDTDGGRGHEALEHHGRQASAADGAGVPDEPDRDADGARPDGAGRGLTLLPTPAVNDMGAGKTVEQWDTWTEAMRSKHGNGNGHGKSLHIEAARLLPTPDASANRKSRRAMTSSASGDGNGRRAGGGMSSPPGLAQIAELASGIRPHDLPDDADLPPHTRAMVDRLLPTPRASEQENRTTRRTPSQQAGKHGLYLSAEVASHWGEYAAAIARHEAVLGRPAPPPTDDEGRLSPRFVEWMMMWPDGWTEPAGKRAARLKACGNGVVVAQALLAYRTLMAMDHS